MPVRRYYESPAALCPFYVGEDATKIICDGPEEKEWLIRSWKKSTKPYKDKYCKGKWQKCPVARMLSELE